MSNSDTAIGIIDNLMHDFGSALVGSDETIASEIADSGSIGWGYDSYNNLSAHFANTNTIEFTVDLEFTGDWEGENSYLGTEIIASVKGRADRQAWKWQVSRYEVVETQMYPRDDPRNEEEFTNSFNE